MFTYFDETNAPQASLKLIAQSTKAYGFLPKLHAVMAAAPIAYQAYLQNFDAFTQQSSLSPLEQQVVMMTANYENRCHYCTAGHSMLMTMYKMPADVIEALREGKPIADSKLETLRSFTRLLIERRGHVGDAELQKFEDAGYTKAQALEVLVGLSAKLLSNFTNALAHTELDAPVKPFAWTHPADRSIAA
jgi:alkylhydroperoxidase family enzyme